MKREKRERSFPEDTLEQENATLRMRIAAKEEKIQKLEEQLQVAENRNSCTFSSGGSFSETGATPHLLNRAMERFFTTSGTFTRLLMQSLRKKGVDCTSLAKKTAPSVSFERDAHTKFFYQALICKVLFTDFENEYFNVDGNAPETILNTEEHTKESFDRYKELIAIQNPDDLILGDALENDFRRLCIAKRKGLVDAVEALGIGHVALFGEVFGRRRESAGAAEARVASSFAKVVLSVFIVHKLAFALHSVARILRTHTGMRFVNSQMEAVVASAESESEDGVEEDDPDVSCSVVGLMIVPGFHVNRIVVLSKVYTMRQSK